MKHQKQSRNNQKGRNTNRQETSVKNQNGQETTMVILQNIKETRGKHQNRKKQLGKTPKQSETRVKHKNSRGNNWGGGHQNIARNKRLTRKQTRNKGKKPN